MYTNHRIYSDKGMRVANQEEEPQFSVLYKHISILYASIGMICKAYMQYNNVIVHQ